MRIRMRFGEHYLWLDFLIYVLGSKPAAVTPLDYRNVRHCSCVLTTNATIEKLYQTLRLSNDPP